MKKLLGSILVSLLLVESAFAASTSVVTLDKNSVEHPEITTGENKDIIKGSLLVNDSETLANMIDEQKEHDTKDLEKLYFNIINFCRNI